MCEQDTLTSKKMFLAPAGFYIKREKSKSLEEVLFYTLFFLRRGCHDSNHDYYYYKKIFDNIPIIHLRENFS